MLNSARSTHSNLPKDYCHNQCNWIHTNSSVKFKDLVLLKLEEASVWPDGYITIQSLAIYNNDNLPRSKKMRKFMQKFAKY